MTNDEIRETLEAVVRKLPDSIRMDLTSADPSIRQSAEETVAIRIAAALGETNLD
jgi:hypothetical protein